jgi:diguanylate cyclase (GGDEF)-like protein
LFAEIKSMSVLSKFVNASGTRQSPHAAYFLLFLLAVFISASDFLIYLPMQFGLPALLHVAAILLPLLLWGVVVKFGQPMMQKIVPVVAYLLLFSLWSYQLYFHDNIDLVVLCGLVLLGIWNGVQSRVQLWVTVVACISLPILLVLFVPLPNSVFIVYCLLLILACAVSWFVFSFAHQQASHSPAQALAETDYLPQSANLESEARLEPISDLEADIAMVHVDTENAPSWEKILRELHNELKNTADIDNLFKSMLVFMSGCIEMEAAAVGMIQERSLNRITQYGPDELVHSKVLAWNNERIKTLIQSQQATVNQQDHLGSSGSNGKLYRIDIPVISNNRTVGIVTLFRTSFLFDEYEVSLASSIVFHSMVALRQARLQEEVRKLQSTTTRKTLYTREQFIERAKEELKDIDKPRVFSLVIAEIDNYDQVNDKYGREAGSRLYKSVAASIMSNLRPDDVLGNYGKEGFILLLHEADLLESKKIAELIRSRASQVKCKIGDAVINTTLSLGLTTVSEQGEDMPSLIRKADMGLFVAKESGRNTVKVSL